jgi:hypothetical protein
MLPFLLAMVVDRARRLALRTLRRRVLGVGQPQVDDPAGDVAVHRPRRLHPKIVAQR